MKGTRAILGLVATDVVPLVGCAAAGGRRRESRESSALGATTSASPSTSIAPDSVSLRAAVDLGHADDLVPAFRRITR